MCYNLAYLGSLKRATHWEFEYRRTEKWAYLGQGCGLELVCHDDDFINATTKFCSRASMWQEERINNTSSHPDLPTNSTQRQRMAVYPLENLCSEPLWNWRWRSFCLFLILDFWLKLLNWYQRTGKCLIRELKTH